MVVDNSQAPRHVAIIMDGNGRWASARGRPRAVGHRIGGRAARAVIESAPDLGIKTLTLFAFSSENWQRPESEVRVLMRLFLRAIRQDLVELHENDVRLRFIGCRSRLSTKLCAQMQHAEDLTRHNSGLKLVVAVDYGGRWDIVEAARQLAARCVQGQLQAEAIDESKMASSMSLAGNAPDLFIRTGGECRISNFLLWDLAYTELYFCDQLWPDFGAQDLQAAIGWFKQRERRFGQVSRNA